MNQAKLYRHFVFFTALAAALVTAVAGVAMPCDVQAFGSLTENGTAAFMGIGINPTKILHVSGTGPGTVPLFQRNSDSAGFIIERTPTNRWVLGVNESPTLGNGFVLSTIPTGTTSVPRLMITQGGNVGIGTTNPQAKLEVNGSFRISESINRQPTNIPLFRWLSVRELATYAAGSHPYGIAFDGTNMWVANDKTPGSVTRITPTGNMTTYTGTGAYPMGIAFDGTNMWTANHDGASVTKISPSGVMTTYTGTGVGPQGIAFDGTYMWVTNSNDATVTKISLNGAMENLTGDTGGYPGAIAFDGTNMWTADYDGNSVTRITPSGDFWNITGIGHGPNSIAFDGTNMWTANSWDSSVTKITPDGVKTTYTGTGGRPYGIAFDGVNMWTANREGGSVTKITPSGAMENITLTGNNPWGIAFDGTNMWTTNYDGNSVTKILVITK